MENYVFFWATVAIVGVLALIIFTAVKWGRSAYTIDNNWNNRPFLDFIPDDPSAPSQPPPEDPIFLLDTPKTSSLDALVDFDDDTDPRMSIPKTDASEV